MLGHGISPIIVAGMLGHSLAILMTTYAHLARFARYAIFQEPRMKQLAYGLAKNFRMISQDLEDYDKARLKLLQDNWELDPETNKYKIPDEEKEKWKALHTELLEAETDYQPFKLDLTLTESIEMTPGEFASLWFIFDYLESTQRDTDE